MSAPVTILDKLRNYEYEKCGCGAIVGDIYALIHHLALLEEEVEDLRVEAREKNAWEGRYNALLEECEASRPREIDGGEDSRDAAEGTTVVDTDGDPWVFDDGGWVRLYPYCEELRHEELQEQYGPYTIVYPPTPKENTND